MPLMCFYVPTEHFLLKKAKQVVKIVNFYAKTDFIFCLYDMHLSIQQGRFPGILQQ